MDEAIDGLCPKRLRLDDRRRAPQSNIILIVAPRQADHAHENIACVIDEPRQSSHRRDRQNGQPIVGPSHQIVALHGHIWAHAVRFGGAQDVMAAGEGIETILSLRSVLPALPMIAALSASNLAAAVFPATLRRLYVAMDADPAGERAAAAIAARAVEAGIEAIVLRPVRNDFNDDLGACGVDALVANLRPQLGAEDVRRFMDR